MNTSYNLNTADGEDIIYLNIQSTNESKDYQRLIANVNRSSYIIRNPQEYQLSLVRFQIPTLSLPLWFMNPNIIYSVSILFNGHNVTTDLVFVNTSNNIPEYGDGVWAFSDLSDMINTAIATSFAGVSGDVGFPPAARAPYMQYETALKSFSVVADQKWNDTYPYQTAGVPHLYFNNNLFNLFNNFKTISDGINVNGLDNLIIITDLFNNRVTTKDALAGYIMTQEFSTTYLINSVSSIAVESNNLPVTEVNQSQVPLVDSSSTNTYIQLIDDFQPALTGGTTTGDQRSIQIYQPSIFRYITMIGSSPVVSISLSISVYLADQNRYVPIFLAPEQFISMRLMFKRKSLNF